MRRRGHTNPKHLPSQGNFRVYEAAKGDE